VASFVKVRNINPLGAVTLVIDGDRREVEAGEVISVTPEFAGRGPEWREPRDGDDLNFHEVERDEDGNAVAIYDLGVGLLAQPGNWELVTDETVKD